MNNSIVERQCPNCRTVLNGDPLYCPVCGQKRIRKEDHSVWHLLIDSIGDFFHFDSKFLATLLPLIYRPGFLTNEYLRGRRVKYFQPFKLFLFISFLYFITAGIMAHKRSAAGEEMVTAYDTISADAKEKIKGGYNFHLAEIHDATMDLPTDSLRKLVHIYGLNRFINMKYSTEGWLTRFLYKQVLKDRLQGSVTFSENMKKTLPKLIFILIPFMALLLKLLYIRRKIPYFDHVIFSLHYLSFVFLLLWFNTFGSILTGWFTFTVLIFMLVYLLTGMLRVYRQTIMKTIGKFVLLFFGSMMMMVFFFLIAASISFLLI